MIFVVGCLTCQSPSSRLVTQVTHASWPMLAGTGRPLIIAVSGDGVYNEVVNGIMDVDGSSAVSAVAAGGNANDHRRSTRRMPLVAAIVDGRARHLDLLRLTVRTNGVLWSRYAHSYVGLGLTPLMAIGLNKDMKGTVMELISVMRTFNRLEPVEISTAAEERALFDSLVFANVARMAKYGRVSNSGRPDDGLFELVSCPHRGRWRIALMVLRAATVGLGKQPRISHCTSPRPRPLPSRSTAKSYTWTPTHR